MRYEDPFDRYMTALIAAFALLMAGSFMVIFLSNDLFAAWTVGLSALAGAYYTVKAGLTR